MRISGRAGWSARLVAAVAVQLTILAVPGDLPAADRRAAARVTVWAAVQHVRAARRAPRPGRRVWSTSAIGLLIWMLAQLMYARDEVLHNEMAPHPSPADVPNLLAFVFAVAAMLMTATAPRSVAGKVRMVLDGVLLATALFGLAWLALLQNAIR